MRRGAGSYSRGSVAAAKGHGKAGIVPACAIGKWRGGGLDGWRIIVDTDDLDGQDASRLAAELYDERIGRLQVDRYV